MSEIDTATVAGCRRLAFANIGEAIADAEELARADADGTLDRLGNWTLGQALGHVAAWASYPYEGYPVTPPWFVRLLGPLLKRRVFRGTLPRGYRLPGVPGGTLGIDVLSTEAGLARFRHSLTRLGDAPPKVRNPVFGWLTHDEWLTLNLRHAELHLGFFVPRS